MPRIQGQRSQNVGITPEVGAEKIPANIFSGEFAAQQASAQGISQAGDMLSDISTKMLQLQQASQLTNAQLEYESAYSDFQLEQLKNPNHEEWVDDFDRFHTAQETKLGALTNSKAKERAALWMKDRKTTNRTRTGFAAYRAMVSGEQALMEGKLDSFTELYTKEGADKDRIEKDVKQYVVGITSSVFTADMAQAVFQKWKGEAEASAQVADDAAQFQQAKQYAISFATLEEAEAAIDALPIDRADRNDLLAIAGRHYGAIEAEVNTEIEADREATRNKIVDGFVNKQLVGMDEYINASSLDGKEKDVWLNKWDARIEALNSGKDDPFDQTDNYYYASLLRRGDYTKSDLDAALGRGKDRGISIDVYKSLMQNIEDGPRAKDSAYKQTVKVLGDMLSSNSFIPVPRIGGKHPVTGEDVTIDDIADAQKANALEWSLSVSRFNKWYDAYNEKYGFPPTTDKQNDWLKQEMFPVVVERVSASFSKRRALLTSLFSPPAIAPFTGPISGFVIKRIKGKKNEKIDELSQQLEALSVEEKLKLQEQFPDGVITAEQALNFLKENK